ncbi:hypothetical protein ACROYT_G034119 [Oculina patagonica]
MDESLLDVTGEESNADLPVNHYGSPVAPRSLQNHPSRVTCQCKNTCSGKSGKHRGCVCRDAGLSCSANCVCGSNAKPCRNNKAAPTSAINETNRPQPPSSALERHQLALERERESVQAFILTLSNEERNRLLLDVLCTRRGSLDYVRNLLSRDNDPEPDGPDGRESVNWCVCNICIDMGNDEENKCCGKRSRVTSYEMFRNVVLDREVLTLAIRARCDIRAEDAEYEMTSYRKAAYRQYILWKYGKLGRGNRRVCPSCVVRVVREAYPAPEGAAYMGFRRN